MNRHVCLLGLAVVASSCSTPTAPANEPSPLLRSEIEKASAVRLTLSGHVIDADNNGAPVVDAKVSIISNTSSTIVDAVTDASGLYRVTFPPQAATIRAEKPGYEPRAGSIQFGADAMVVDFAVRRIVRIPAGASTPVTITNDDVVCGYEVDAYPCRTVRVVAAHSGTMTLELTDPTPMSWVFLQGIGQGASYSFHLDRASLVVSAGQEVVVQILCYPAPSSVTLNTGLQ
jgi:hypothetical protein